MSVFNNTGAAEAAASLAVARALGTQGTFKHRDNAAVDVYIEIISMKVLSAEPQKGRLVEGQEIVCRIPNQTGFTALIDTPAKPITVNDRMEYPKSSGHYFYIQKDSDIEMDENGYAYLARFESRKTINLGTK